MLPRGEYVASPENHPTAIETVKQIDVPVGQVVELSGHVRGADTVNYLFFAASYDILEVKILASGRNCAFNVYRPDGEPLYDGWAEGPRWGDTLDYDGAHRIEVYMGFKAEPGEGSDYTLRVERTV